MYRYVSNQIITRVDPSGLKILLRLIVARRANQYLGGHVDVIWVNEKRTEWVLLRGGGGSVSGFPANPTPKRTPTIGTQPGAFPIPENKLWDVVLSPYPDPADELKALTTVFNKLKQIPYDALSTNSNAYAHQLLKLSGFTVKDVYIKDQVEITSGVVGEGSYSTKRPGQLPFEAIGNDEIIPPPIDVYYTPVAYPAHSFFGISSSYYINRKVGPTATPGWHSNDWYGGRNYDAWGRPR